MTPFYFTFWCSLMMSVTITSQGIAQCENSRNLDSFERTFKSAKDGSTQRYVELLPSNFTNTGSYDLVIGLHGHGSDRWQFAVDNRDECKAFRDFAYENNMIAVTPDYRGKTSWMGPEAEDDVKQILEMLKLNYNIRRVFIVGGSMGGTSALTFAALNPHLVDGIVSLNGHANHLEFENFQDAISESFRGKKDQIPVEYKKRSAEYWPENLYMPIAITVGELDKSVPPFSAVRLAEIVKKIGGKVLLINQKGVGHRTSYENAMRAFNFVYNEAK